MGASSVTGRGRGSISTASTGDLSTSPTTDTAYGGWYMRVDSVDMPTGEEFRKLKQEVADLKEAVQTLANLVRTVIIKEVVK